MFRGGIVFELLLLMSKNILLSLVLIAILFSSLSASAVDLTERDKNMHAGLSFQLTATSNHTLRKLGLTKTTSSAISAGAVFFLGLLKEFAIDRKADQRDIQADAVGTALGAVIPFRIEF